MTWKQFLEWAEQQGVKDDDVLAYVDFPSDGPASVEVLQDDLNGSRRIAID